MLEYQIFLNSASLFMENCNCLFKLKSVQANMCYNLLEILKDDNIPANVHFILCVFVCNNSGIGKSEGMLCNGAAMSCFSA